MKQKAYIVPWIELQDWLDKYEEKIKFVVPNINTGMNPNIYCLIIDES